MFGQVAVNSEANLAVSAVKRSWIRAAGSTESLVYIHLVEMAG